MSAFPRESSFLAAIKCSSCGRDIEISMMGDHICSGPGAEPLPSTDFSRFRSNNQLPVDKYSRMPPRVDTSAANRPFVRNGQLTPVSTSSGSRSLSPKTPDGRPGAGRGNDYFEPKIANEYDSTPPQGRRGGYGGYSDRDEYGMDPLYPSSSPKKSEFLQRMNSIAPGPFETGGRRRGGARNAQDNYDNARIGYGIDRPGTAASNISSSSGSNNGGAIAPPRVPRKNGYGGFGPPQRSQDDFEPEPFSATNRSETFPRPSDPIEPPLRTPSAPGPRPDRLRRPSNTSRPPPPQTPLLRPRTSGKDSAPGINLADEFGIGNPYHTPSASISSATSAYSRPSESSRSSPSRGRTDRYARNPSDTSGFDNLMSDLKNSMNDLGEPKDLPPTPRRPAPFEKAGSNRREGMNTDPWLDRAAQGSRPRGRPLQPEYDLKAEMERAASAAQSLRAGGRRGASRGRGEDRWRSRDEPSPARSRSLAPGTRDPATQSSRGSCKACGQTITGKSISSADGRLTGRYHKACFTCTTCYEPFSSAEFYVLDDKPYCELHYHKLNGSLCNSCGRGIEGEYLEDETMAKYHVGCFRCGDCGMSLSNGYFEVDGKTFCERDAWRRAQQPWQNGISAQGRQTPSPAPTTMSGPAALPLPSPSLPPVPPPPAVESSPSRARALSRAPSMPNMGMGGQRPASRRPSNGSPPQPIGLPRGQRLPPGMGPTPRPRMNKRMTRLGMM